MQREKINQELNLLLQWLYENKPSEFQLQNYLAPGVKLKKQINKSDNEDIELKIRKKLKKKYIFTNKNYSQSSEAEKNMNFIEKDKQSNQREEIYIELND